MVGWTGGCNACRKLESSQMKMGRDCWGKAVQWQCRESRVEEAGGKR